MVLELLEHKSVFSPGYKCVLHLHAAVEECQVDRIVEAMDPKTKERKKVRELVVGDDFMPLCTLRCLNSFGVNQCTRYLNTVRYQS